MKKNRDGRSKHLNWNICELSGRFLNYVRSSMISLRSDFEVLFTQKFIEQDLAYLMLLETLSRAKNLCDEIC